jgi:hypothetical protein
VLTLVTCLAIGSSDDHLPDGFPLTELRTRAEGGAAARGSRSAKLAASYERAAYDAVAAAVPSLVDLAAAPGRRGCRCGRVHSGVVPGEGGPEHRPDGWVGRRRRAVAPRASGRTPRVRTDRPARSGQSGSSSRPTGSRRRRDSPVGSGRCHRNAHGSRHIIGRARGASRLGPSPQ